MTTPFRSEAAEHLIISAALIDWPTVSATLANVEVDDFTDLRAKLAWGALRNIEARGEEIDVISVASELERQGVDQNFGYHGDWLGEQAAAQVNTSPAHIKTLVDLLRKLSARRREAIEAADAELDDFALRDTETKEDARRKPTRKNSTPKRNTQRDHGPPGDIPPPNDTDAPTSGAAKFNPRVSARKYLSRRMTADGLTIRRWRGDWYRWSESTGCYSPLSDDRIDVELYDVLPEGTLTELARVRLALMAADRVLVDEVELGAWLDGEPPPGIGALDALACRNGLVHLPTGDLIPTTPRYFTTTAIPLSYNPVAPQPTRWLAFLNQLWPSDQESILFLQEWIGYLLTPDTRHHKIAWMIGKPRSGKGTIGRVVTALLGGKSNVAGPTLAQFGTNFGLQPLVGKLAAIIADARLSGRSDQSLIIERLLSTSGEDPQNVDRKNREPWYGILQSRITIISNEIPKLTEASTALADRSIFLHLPRTFLGNEDIDLTNKLLAELPGILNWAIDGWRRLQAKGRFSVPAMSRKMAKSMVDIASPVGAWARQRCVTDEANSDCWIRCDAAYSDFKTWCVEMGQQHVPTQTMFGRDIDTATGCERHRLRPKFIGGPRPWVYRGMRLKTEDEINAAEEAEACDGN